MLDRHLCDGSVYFMSYSRLYESSNEFVKERLELVMERIGQIADEKAFSILSTLSPKAFAITSSFLISRTLLRTDTQHKPKMTSREETMPRQ